MTEQNQNLSVSEAAALLASRRVQAKPEPTEATPAPEPTPQELPPEEEHPVEDSDLEEGEVGAEEEYVEEEIEDGELEESAETDDPEGEPEVEVLTLEDDTTVVIDGEEVTGAELRKRGLRESDYTQKTQALAAQRDALQKREQLVAVRLGQQQAAITQRLQQFENVNWTALAQDPEQYQAAKAQYDALQMQGQQLEQEARQFFQQIEATEAAAQKEAARVAAAELKRTIPGWNNAMYYSLVDYAADTGFDRDEVLKYTDPRVFHLLQKAKAYDEAQKVGTKKVVKTAGKRTVTRKAPTGRTAPPKTAADLGRARQALQKSGNMDDAVKLMQAKRAEAARKRGRS